MFELKGDQWTVEGHILKWNDGLNVLGVHTGYKMTRIGSRYLRAEDERARERTAYDIAEPRWNGVWRWLYRHASSLPFVKAVYGNTAYTFPSDEIVWNVYVSTSGFFIMKGKDPPPDVWR